MTTTSFDIEVQQGLFVAKAIKEIVRFYCDNPMTLKKHIDEMDAGGGFSDAHRVILTNAKNMGDFFLRAHVKTLQ